MIKTGILIRIKAFILRRISISIEEVDFIRKNSIIESKTFKVSKPVKEILSKSNYSKEISVYTTPQGSVYELSNIVIHGSSGLISKNKKYLIESALNFNRFKKIQNSLLILFKKTNKAKVNNRIYTSFIHLPWSKSSNYHWFIDSLSRIYLLQKYADKELTILIHKTASDFQKKTLEFCISEKWKIEELETTLNLEIKKFVFPSFLCKENSGFLDPEVLKFLKDKIISGYTNDSKKKSKVRRIYVSRKNASIRTIQNEVELIEFLSKYGFETIYAEKLPYGEQVELFQQAEIIVSIHGAGLTNIMFSDKPTVIEFHPDYRTKSHYALLSSSINATYIPIFLKTIDRKVDRLLITKSNIDFLGKVISTPK